jgi:HEAT repeat protein
MKVLSLSAFLISTVGMAQNDKFADCVSANGPAFQKARDQFLTNPVDEALLKKNLESKVWQERLTAHILLGWSQRKDEYRKLLATPKATSARGSAHYPWATTPGAIKPEDVPLLYELLMKDGDATTAQDAARALLALVQSKLDKPDEMPIHLDVPLLHQYLQDEKTVRLPGRGAVAWLIGALPVKYQAEDELKKSLKAGLALKEKEPGIIESLLRGFARAAEAMPADQKDKLVQELLASKELEGTVGKVPLTYALGNIGGDKASELVASYLEKSTDDLEKRWALDTLSRSDSLVATRVLVKYADDTKPSLRRAAVDGLALGRVPHTPDSLAKMEAVAMDAKAPELLQLKAVQGLVTISAKNPKNKDLQKQIKAHLQTISASNPKSDKLVKELKSILRKMQ